MDWRGCNGQTSRPAALAGDQRAVILDLSNCYRDRLDRRIRVDAITNGPEGPIRTAPAGTVVPFETVPTRPGAIRLTEASGFLHQSAVSNGSRPRLDSNS
jgi:hypothetical protein